MVERVVLCLRELRLEMFVDVALPVVDEVAVLAVDHRRDVVHGRLRAVGTVLAALVLRPAQMPNGSMWVRKIRSTSSSVLGVKHHLWSSCRINLYLDFADTQSTCTARASNTFIVAGRSRPPWPQTTQEYNSPSQNCKTVNKRVERVSLSR